MNVVGQTHVGKTNKFIDQQMLHDMVVFDDGLQ